MRGICSLGAFVFLAIAGCASQPPREMMMQIASREPGCLPDTFAAWEGAGITSPDALLARACLNEPDAIYKVLWLTRHAHLDAASSEGHAAVVECLLYRSGDLDFASECSRLNESERDAVRGVFEYTWLESEARLATCERFCSMYPLTFRILTGRTEPEKVPTESPQR